MPRFLLPWWWHVKLFYRKQAVSQSLSTEFRSSHTLQTHVTLRSCSCSMRRDSIPERGQRCRVLHSVSWLAEKSNEEPRKLQWAPWRPPSRVASSYFRGPCHCLAVITSSTPAIAIPAHQCHHSFVRHVDQSMSTDPHHRYRHQTHVQSHPADQNEGTHITIVVPAELFLKNDPNCKTN